MPMPLWFGHINKWVFNKRELNKGQRPVINHVGRSSGAPFRTPLDAHRVDDGYIFILVYGSKSDWVKNIMAAGRATLDIDGQQISLTSPRVINTEEAWSQMPATAKRPPKQLNISEYLHMTLADA